MAKRKYHVGHAVPEKWVFGMFNVHQKIGILRFVDDRTQATLFPLIQEYVLPGSTIHSDRAAMYVNNQAGVDPPPSHIVNIPVNLPYIHTSVNHKHFVDPISRTHTNHVEGFWNTPRKIINKCVEPLRNYFLPIWTNSNGANCMERKKWRLLRIFCTRFQHITPLTIDVFLLFIL